jgi:hypothetical protein
MLLHDQFINEIISRNVGTIDHDTLKMKFYYYPEANINQKCQLEITLL